MTATVDEEFGDVTACNCECEAFYNYDGMCKHCVAMLLTYVNRRSPVEILRLKRGEEAKNLDNKPVVMSEFGVGAMF